MLRAYFLNGVAVVALRLLKPDQAAKLVGRLGGLGPPLEEGAVRRTVVALRGGTCLSRSLAAAALTENSEVVIGVPPLGSPQWAAHAWLEVGGMPVLPHETRGAPIARLVVRPPKNMR